MDWIQGEKFIALANIMYRVTIVMTHWNRQKQLIETLNSFAQYDPKSFNVIIVDNASDEEAVIPKTSFNVKVIRLTDKSFINPVVAYNVGYIEALKNGADVIITQHSECYHEGDILGYAQNIDNDVYVSFGCYSLAENETPRSVIVNNRAARSNGDSAWYNHPVYRPVGYNFCFAITAENLIKLNGFDERFQFGPGYEDNYFLHQVKTLGLKVDITADPFVYHQWHPRNYISGSIARNRKLYSELSTKSEYRAMHIHTQNLEHASK